MPATTAMKTAAPAKVRTSAISAGVCRASLDDTGETLRIHFVFYLIKDECAPAGYCLRIRHKAEIGSTLLDDALVHQTQKWIRSLTSPTQVWICVDPNRPFARDGMRGPDCRGNIGGSTLAVPTSTRLIADCSRHEPPGISWALSPGCCSA